MVHRAPALALMSSGLAFATGTSDLPPQSWPSCVSQAGEVKLLPAPAASISLPVSIF